MNILVIGAGVIGAAIARALAERGASVTVLDMRAPGRGASWASAGVLAPYIEAHGDTPLLQLGVRSLALFDDFIGRARDRSGRAIEYARPGTCEVALSDDEAPRLTAAKAWLDAKGAASEWIDRRQLPNVEPAVSQAALGGLLIPAHGYAGVPSLIAALVRCAEIAGAVFESAVEAIEVVSARDFVQVRAGGREYRADHVVMAAGSWSSRVRVAGMAPLPVRPVKGQLLHLRWRHGTAPTRVVWSSDCYTVPWSDGTLLVGATVEDVGFDESTTVAAAESLKAAAGALLPDAARADLLEARAGLRPATPDGLPFIGALAEVPRVTVATGHFRNGVLLAPLTAAMVEALILDGRADAMMALTSPARLAARQGEGS